jgi:hypothetical protein
LKLLWLLLLSVTGAYGVTVQTTSHNCTPGLDEATKTIVAAHFPDDWRVVLVCDLPTWDYLRRKADALAARNAFTNLNGHITVVNWQLFARPSVTRPARRVLSHEKGHISCACGDEHRAEAYALNREMQSAAENRENLPDSTTPPASVTSAQSEQRPTED